jgi:ABC-2 type transport system permease protein
MYVTSEKQLKAYALQGHGEATLADLSLTATIGYENYEIVDLNLLTAAAVPSDADILLVVSPKTDFSVEDGTKIHDYLAGGGRAIFLLDLPEKPGARKNLEELMASYGIALKDVLAVEGDANSMAGSNPLYLLPTLEYHVILQPLRDKKLPVLIPFSLTLEPLGLRRQTLKIEPLLSSSENSWAKVNYANMTSTDKEAGDLEGPLLLAVAITDPAADASKQDMKLVVVGSSIFLDPSLASQVPGNIDFFVNSMSWLTDKTENISIRPKDLLTMRLSLNETQTMALSGVVVILLPVLLLGAGLVTWLRRRHL